MKQRPDTEQPSSFQLTTHGNRVKKPNFASSLGARLLLTSVTSAVLSGVAHGQGQSPSQQPPGERAGEDKPDAVLSLPEPQGLRAPDGAELTSFVVGSISLEGGQPEINARAAALAPAAGTTLSVAELFAYAGRVQSQYFDAGYPLVRVVIPAQDIQPEGSNVRILIVSGFIEGIDSSALSGRVAGQVEKLLLPLIGDTTVSAGELERRILLAGDTAGLRLKSALTPGAEIGATSLIVTGDYKPVDAVISIDNRVIEDVGREQATFSLALNSLLGRGEQVVLTTATALSDPGLGETALRSYAGLSATLPVGTEGWSVGVQLLQASNAPDPVAAGVQFDNEFVRAGINASYALQRTRRASSVLSFAFDASYEEQQLQLLGLQASLFADRTRVARASVSGYSFLGDRAQVSYDAQVSKGIDGLGARSADDATALRPLSRDGADASFYKLSAGGSLTREVLEGLSLQASVRAQSSFNEPLVRSEQTSIVSPGLVSGPPSGSVTGDRMIAGRTEAQTLLRISDSVLLQPYVALAAGESHLEKPTALERRHSSASSMGIGVRTQFDIMDRRTLSAQLEWARVESSDERLDRDWLGFSVALKL
jgi:hemolysin activation/secretion protein